MDRLASVVYGSSLPDSFGVVPHLAPARAHPPPTTPRATTCRLTPCLAPTLIAPSSGGMAAFIALLPLWRVGYHDDKRGSTGIVCPQQSTAGTGFRGSLWESQCSSGCSPRWPTVSDSSWAAAPCSFRRRPARTHRMNLTLNASIPKRHTPCLPLLTKTGEPYLQRSMA